VTSPLQCAILGALPDALGLARIGDVDLAHGQLVTVRSQSR
jgi:hypothetical protein